MGKTGKFMRSVFSRSHTGATEKRRWGVSVRMYLCSENLHNSAEGSVSVKSSTVKETNSPSFRSNGAVANISSATIEGRGFDSSSVISSEATVTQPLQYTVDRNEEHKREENRNSTYALFRQEDAALIIQSALKNFLAKRRREGANNAKDENKCECTVMTSPSKGFMGTSVEVQAGNSKNASDILSIDEENLEARHNVRLRTKAQVLKSQEDWDASTVSSVISKTRIQNKLEAATRRERALAYAFSQQLRISTKKKQSMSNGEEGNTGWNWLERWMAAREPETKSKLDNRISGGHKTVVRRKRMFDTSTEAEKESCGSNEVSSLFEVSAVSVPNNIPRPPPKYRGKARRPCSRQGSVSNNINMCPKKSKGYKKNMLLG